MERAYQKMDSQQRAYQQRGLSVIAFVEDLKVKFKDEYDKAVQVWVYFFPDKSTYSETYEKTYGLRTEKKEYINLRPEVITFICPSENETDSSGTKFERITKQDGFDDYKQRGIRFETHIPRRNDPKKLRGDRELRRDKNVNYLIINTEQKSFSKMGKFDIIPSEIKYYEWTVFAPFNQRNDSKYLMKEIYPNVEQFKATS